MRGYQAHSLVKLYAATSEISVGDRMWGLIGSLYACSAKALRHRTESVVLQIPKSAQQSAYSFLLLPWYLFRHETSEVTSRGLRERWASVVGFLFGAEMEPIENSPACPTPVRTDRTVVHIYPSETVSCVLHVNYVHRSRELERLQVKTRHHTLQNIDTCPFTIIFWFPYAGIAGTIALQTPLLPTTKFPLKIVFESLSHNTIFPNANSKIVSAAPAFGSAASMNWRQAWTKFTTPLARVIWPLTTDEIAGRTAD